MLLLDLEICILTTGKGDHSKKGIASLLDVDLFKMVLGLERFRCKDLAMLKWILCPPVGAAGLEEH